MRRYLVLLVALTSAVSFPAGTAVSSGASSARPAAIAARPNAATIRPIGRPPLVPAAPGTVMEINRQPIRSGGDFQRRVAARTGDAFALYGYDPSVGRRRS